MTRLVAGLLMWTFVLHGSTGPGVQTRPANRDAEVPSDFKARVEKYVDLRKAAADEAPPLEKTADPAKGTSTSTSASSPRRAFTISFRAAPPSCAKGT